MAGGGWRESVLGVTVQTCPIGIAEISFDDSGEAVFAKSFLQLAFLQLSCSGKELRVSAPPSTLASYHPALMSPVPVCLVYLL